MGDKRREEKRKLMIRTKEWKREENEAKGREKERDENGRE